MESLRDQQTFTCDICHRQAGRDLVVCPKRATQFCPFEVQQHRLMRTRMVIMSLVFGGAFLLGAILLFFALPLERVSNFSRWMIYGIGAVMLSIGVAALLYGVYGIFGKQTLVINPQTRQLWQEHHLFGWRVRQFIVTQAETLGDTLDLDVLHLPVSLVALYVSSDGTSYRGRLYKRVYIDEAEHNETARIVVLMTLIGLLANGTLKLWRTHTIKHQQPTHDYVLTAGDNVAVIGTLESHMLDIIHQWHHDVSIVSKSPQGIPVRAFTSKLYDHTEIDPYKALLEQVQHDAVQHDVAHVQPHGLRFKHEHIGFLNRDGLRVQRTYEEFIKRWEADFIALRHQITAGIESRVDGD